MFFLSEIYFFFTLSVVFLFFVTYSLSSVLFFPKLYININYISMVLLLHTLVLSVNTKVCILENLMLQYNESIILLIVFIITISVIIFIVTYPYNNTFNISYLEYVIFILISLGCMIIIVSVQNFILIFIILEIQSMLMCVLISINKYNRYSIEASIKYFILGSFSSLILLFGISIVYGSTGMLNINSIHIFITYIEHLNNEFVCFLIDISSIFILIGLLFKIYSAPLHFWLPEVYYGTPYSVLIYLSTIPFFIMTIFFIKIYYMILFDLLKYIQYILYIIAFLTLLFGSIGALLQNKLKKLIGYSTVTMNGYFLYSILNNNLNVLLNSLVYTFIYVLTILLFFTLLLSININNNNTINKLSDFCNLFTYNKVLSNIFIILIFSLSGIPPFIGFISKIFWLQSLVFNYDIFIFILIIIFLIVSYYYFRVIKYIYFIYNNTNNNINRICTISYENSIVVFSVQLLLLLSVVDTVSLRSFFSIMLLNIINIT